MTERGDADLALAFQRGAREAGDALLRRHDALIVGIVRALCRRWRRWQPDEEALAQEARIIFLRLLAGYAPERGELVPYVRATLGKNLLAELGANSALRRKRKALVRQAVRLRAGEAVPVWALPTISLDGEREKRGAAGEVADDSPNAAERFEQREEEHLVAQAVAGLEPVRAEVIRRRYFNLTVQTQEEVALALGMSRSNVGQLETNAIQRLRRRCRLDGG